MKKLLGATVLAGAILGMQASAMQPCAASTDYQSEKVICQMPFTPKRHEPTTDSSKYICASQKEDDAIQFHLEGHMECFSDECAKNNEPRYSEGGFSKTYWLKSNDGIKRFVVMKGSHSPSEFYSIRGNNIYLEEEVMTWNPYSNNEYRDHHDANGNPNHLWAKTNDIAHNWVSPNIGDFFWRYCDKSQPDDFVEFHTGGYFVLPSYNLTKSNIHDIEREIAPYSTDIDPGWLNLNIMFDKPNYDVWLQGRVNYWAPFGSARGNTPHDWWAQETYWYVMLKDPVTNDTFGVGFVRWNEGSHERPEDPITINKQGTLNRVVYEQTPLRALGLCEVLPKSTASAEDFLRYEPRTYLNVQTSKQ